MVGRQPEPVVIGDDGVVRHRHQRIMRLVISLGGEERFIGGNQRNIMLVSKADHAPLMGTVVAGLALQFDVETVPEE
ncbi:hypothetical protein D3C78_1378090 [compost metagenome]